MSAQVAVARSVRARRVFCSAIEFSRVIRCSDVRTDQNGVRGGRFVRQAIMPRASIDRREQS